MIAPGILWVAVLRSIRYRHTRFVTGAAVWTAAWLGTQALLTGTGRVVITLLLGLVAAAAFSWPQRLGLALIRGPELDADRALRRSSAAEANGGRLPVEGLSRRTFPVATGEWAVAARLLRWSLIRDAQAGGYSSLPAVLLESTARAFWRAASRT